MRNPKPPLSLWLAAERKRHGLKPADVSQRLTAMGYDAAETTVRTWEAGRAPRVETIAALEKLFGSTAPVDAQPGDNGELVSAIRELVAEVRLSRLAADKNADVLAQLLGVVMAGRLPHVETGSASDAPATAGSEQ